MSRRGRNRWLPVGRGNPWVRFAGLAALLLVPALARAQGSTADARVAFERGVAALDEGRYRDAIEALERSRAIRDVPVVEYNLGLAYRGVGRYVDAASAFERYLAHPDPGAQPAEVEAVRHTLSELRESLATLEVHATPPIATVLVDGRPVALSDGRAVIDPGSHVVEITADGFLPERRSIELGRGEHHPIDVVLHAAGGPGRLVVIPSVNTAVTSIDGIRLPTPTVDRPLPAGEHRVTIRAPGYEPFERTVTIGPTGVVRVEARLARASHIAWQVPVGIAAGVVVLGIIVGGVFIATQPRQGDLSRIPATTLPTVYE